MYKKSHLTIRLERDDFIAFETIAEDRGRSVPEHLRLIIDDDLKGGSSRVRNGLMYDIAYCAVASLHLLILFGDEEILEEHQMAVRAAAIKWGVGHVDW